ncbi:type I-E CRISPR-associated protein Cas7/Cse4/CasC [Sphingomonas sp. Mn802worker]|uniref:type I-E CRISPR-associated protein Cas7/Cse4/CasC n=1 Tax=Sphingomonas sp. Mn802worker TaxID=629773 RepID=UPI0003756418|nr:type I-E CRISPR-associated protein Cas7/Cse4/CasC [Sphingomonas sp. Mn802worker]
MTSEAAGVVPKFIQIHFLAAWPGALLNRDDAGLAKRLPFGNAVRTRISSQCLKRHWRMADDTHALHALARANGVEGLRSKVAIEREVTGPLRARFDKDMVDAVEEAFLVKFYGKNAKDKQQRQALLFGRPELTWLCSEAERLLSESASAAGVKAAAEVWAKEQRNNLNQLRDQNMLAASLEAALFGRMVTSDTRANRDAAIHVAHAFTVHPEQAELDYFTVVDDLSRRDLGDDAGAAGVFDTELTSGLYYGYVVVDVPLLVSNLTGCARGQWAGDHDRALAAQVVEHLVHLVAEVSPGAKKGSTAPYSRAELVLVEAGDRQPRTLANAFRDAVETRDRTSNGSLGRRTASKLSDHLSAMDRMYETGEARRHAALPDLALDGVAGGSLRELAAWAGAAVRDARVVDTVPA